MDYVVIRHGSLHCGQSNGVMLHGIRRLAPTSPTPLNHDIPFGWGLTHFPARFPTTTFKPESPLAGFNTWSLGHTTPAQTVSTLELVSPL